MKGTTLAELASKISKPQDEAQKHIEPLEDLDELYTNLIVDLEMDSFEDDDMTGDNPDPEEAAGPEVPYIEPKLGRDYWNILIERLKRRNSKYRNIVRALARVAMEDFPNIFKVIIDIDRFTPKQKPFESDASYADRVANFQHPKKIYQANGLDPELFELASAFTADIRHMDTLLTRLNKLISYVAHIPEDVTRQYVLINIAVTLILPFATHSNRKEASSHISKIVKVLQDNHIGHEEDYLYFRRALALVTFLYLGYWSAPNNYIDLYNAVSTHNPFAFKVTLPDFVETQEAEKQGAPDDEGAEEATQEP